MSAPEIPKHNSENLFEKVSRLKEVLVEAATGKHFEEINEEYQELRKSLVSIPHIKGDFPEFVVSCRELLDFWDFITNRPEDTGYASRRIFLGEAFHPLLTMLEIGEYSQVGNKRAEEGRKLGKPRVFVASSVEGLNVAYAVQEHLDSDAEVTVWNQGVFQLSSNALDDLIDDVLPTTDFGVFVFSPDDALKIRGKEYQSVRDNVILELGMFIGRLGKRQCFIVSPRTQDPFRIPTDLLGVTPATYTPESERSDGNLSAALGPACNQIRQAIKNVQRIQQPVAPESQEGQQEEGAKLLARFEALIKSISGLSETVQQLGEVRFKPLFITYLSCIEEFKSFYPEYQSLGLEEVRLYDEQGRELFTRRKISTILHQSQAVVGLLNGLLSQHH